MAPHLTPKTKMSVQRNPKGQAPSPWVPRDSPPLGSSPEELCLSLGWRGQAAGGQGERGARWCQQATALTSDGGCLLRRRCCQRRCCIGMVLPSEQALSPWPPSDSVGQRRCGLSEPEPDFSPESEPVLPESPYSTRVRTAVPCGVPPLHPTGGSSGHAAMTLLSGAVIWRQGSRPPPLTQAAGCCS